MFLDPIDWDYRIETVYKKPIGGSQSALCYLSEQLVASGHEIFLVNQTSVPGISCGVFCFNKDCLTGDFLGSMDLVVNFNSAGNGVQLRKHLGNKSKLIMWTQHDHKQPSMKMLHNSDERDAYDAYIFISDWQRQKYCKFFGINPSCAHVLRNAIAPAFQNQFDTTTSILEQKTGDLLLAYTSTPFRGLDILLNMFPALRKRVPAARLKVYSSMQVYMKSVEQDDYRDLYRLARETEGVDYVGSLPQAELACELRRVSVLSYSNTFAETSCISVMEAMASGCLIVTSDLGAIPETAAGYARLVPFSQSKEEYSNQFIEAAISATEDILSGTREIEDMLRRQVNYVNEHCTWSVRAREWCDWLNLFYGNNSQ
jgi:glycosyltransferase involved in cell wall biosynthesis